MVYKIKRFKIAKRLKFTVMKNIFIFSVLLVSILQVNLANAQDDVYDAPRPKQVKVKQTYSAPVEQTEKIIPVETTQSYDEDRNSNYRISSNNDKQPNYSNNNNGNYYSDNDYSSDFGYGYSDRIRRFHNSSIQFSYGFNSYNNFYDPYNSYNNNWNTWDNYSFTPSWTYGYNNFYNPFCSNNQIIIIQPGFSSWYNTGFYNPYSFNSWNNYSYGFSPYCSNAIYNYGYSNYEGYYDNNRKNVVYTPRTGGYNNTNHITKGNVSNYNYNSPSNNNNGGGFTTGNNTQQNVSSKKWNNGNSNNSNTENNNVYKYNNNNRPTNTYNNQNIAPNNQNTAPANNNNSWGNSNNNNNSNSGNSGIKIGTKPK